MNPLQVARGAATSGISRRIDLFRPTAPGLRFLEWGAKNGVWRGGNDTSKSYTHAAHVVHLGRGTHPWRPDFPKPPVEILLMGYSWQSMDMLLRYVWHFLPPDERDQRLRYEMGGGIRGFKEPRIPLVAGPGKGSVIHLRTYKQGAESVAGLRCHYAGLDEPPHPGIIGEVLGRTSTYDGETRATFTPTPASPPQDELRALVEEEIFQEMQVSLSLEACTPIGGVPWKTREAIDRKIESWLPLERPMRRDGAWEPVLEGRQLDAFAEHHKERPPGDVEVHVCVTTDHGIRPGRQATVFLAYDGKKIWAFAEYRPQGTTSTRQDGIAIVQILKDFELSVQQVHYWVGDRSVQSKTSRKDNGRLAHAIADAAGVSRHEAGIWIDTPDKGANSVYTGIALMNGLFHEDRLFVDPIACPHLVESIQRWEGKTKDPAKDLLDACRYGVEKLIEARVIAPPRSYIAA